MNTNEIKVTGENEYEYRGYTISGNENIRFICIAPYGYFSPKSYATINEAKAAIDEDIAYIAEKYGEQ